MNEPEIRSIVINEIKQIAPDTAPENLQPDDNIRTKLEIDSFDALQIVVALDEKFGIEIPEADYGKIQTLKNITAYLFEKLSTGPQSR
jgi:acyl carrier protein